jgi:hypothetical protein
MNDHYLHHRRVFPFYHYGHRYLWHFFLQYSSRPIAARVEGSAVSFWLLLDCGTEQADGDPFRVHILSQVTARIS